MAAGEDPERYGVIAIATGLSPTLISLRALLVAVRIGVTVLEPLLTAYAVLPSGVIAIAAGKRPTLIARPGLLVAEGEIHHRGRAGQRASRGRRRQDPVAHHSPLRPGRPFGPGRTGLGYLELDRRGAELLFQVLTEREERASIAIASNAAFSKAHMFAATCARRQLKMHGFACSGTA